MFLRGHLVHRPFLAITLLVVDDTGSFFPVPDEAELPERLRSLFGKARAALGFVPNVLRVYSFRPERLSAWFSHFKLLHEPTENLSAADREMIAVVVSQTNGCLYCLVAHGQALRDALGDPVLGDRITLDWRRSGLDKRRTAICAYSEKLTRSPREIGAEDLASLRGAGLTDAECWDVAEITAMYNFTNRLAMATNMLPNPEYHGLSRLPAGHQATTDPLSGEANPVARERVR
jgi:uncharacterized peroxidase-related enzyme